MVRHGVEQGPALTERPSDRLRETYDRWARRRYSEPSGPPDPRQARKFEGVWSLLERCCLPCERFLDAGCGDGRYLVAVGSRAGSLAGIDLSGEMVETARRALEREGLEADLRRANLEELPFEDGSFDVVFSSQVIEHLLAPEQGAAELARVTAPGGRVLLTTDNSRSLSRVLNAPRALVRRLAVGSRPTFEFPHRSFAVAEVLELLRGAGLEPERVETFRFHLDPPLDEERFPRLQRGLNAVDRALPPHRLGDIVAVVARRDA